MGGTIKGPNHEREPMLTLPGWPETRDWTAQKPRTDPNMARKKSIK